MLDTAADMGIGEEAFLDLLPRDFNRQVDAYRRRVEREIEMTWRHVTLPVLNHLRDVMNVQIGTTTGKKGKIKPLTPADIGLPDREGEAARKEPVTPEEWADLMEHIERVRATGTRTVLN